MSDSVPERLRQLQNEVHDLRVPPASEVRARGRIRGRRRTAGVLIGAAVLATTAGVAATVAGRPGPGTTAAGPATATAAPAATTAVRPSATTACDLSLPSSPGEVRVRVLDGGAPGERTATAVADLRRRGFVVLPPGGAPAGPTTLHYGPATIGAVTLLHAQLVDRADRRFDPDRADDVIDLALGADFVRLASPTEVNQAFAMAGRPSAPPGC